MRQRGRYLNSFSTSSAYDASPTVAHDVVAAALPLRAHDIRGEETPNSGSCFLVLAPTQNLIRRSQYNLLLLASGNLMFRLRTSPQAYGAALDYGSQMLNTATIYGSNLSSTSFGQRMMHGNQAMQKDLVSTRSPM